MDISRKTDYALRILSMLVENGDELLSVRVAAEQVDVPYSFARSIQHGLVQAGIIESLRGVRGGMRLKANPEELTIYDIVRAVQGPFVINECTAADGDCPRMETCCFHPLWMGVEALLNDYLSSVTLADVVEGRRFPAVDAKFADRGAFAEYARCAALKNVGQA
ncbi:Rrf2 family transcriptional regulator [uncultured Enorma sp.]|uniref:RrF2 family transcriptional regulator n=1 Tax=Enorma sp. TaxID=1920692 RepID=UPI00261C0F1A|nr:Rrf2 family transcriptional regulator [uncultured Enorma sp.]